MDAQAPPALGDVDDGGDELGQLGHQGGELVDHHDEAGQGLGRLRRTVLLKVAAARRPEQRFPQAHLGSEAAERPSRKVGVEVGHHRHGVRQIGTRVERAAPFEVDEDEVHVVGAGAGGHRGDPRAQQLALTGPGRAGHQGVRSVGHQVEDERSGRARTHDGGERAAARSPPPREPIGEA